MTFVDSYATIWAGIFIGMMLAAMFFGVVGPMPRRWFAVFAAVFLLCAFGVRPFIDMLVVTP